LYHPHDFYCLFILDLFFACSTSLLSSALDALKVLLFASVAGLMFLKLTEDFVPAFDQWLKDGM
jgi:hypothetical protein